MKCYILFNPLSGNGGCENKMQSLVVDKCYETVYYDATKQEDLKKLFSSINEEDRVILCGGDGTLNRFINDIGDIEIKNEILYFAAGSGNDFLRDIEKNNSIDPIRINEYIENLPVMTVKGKIYRFINGIGFGLDGYCCEECNRIRKEKNKKANYTLIAIKGLLGAYTPVNATVKVDGQEYKYKKVWMASCMKGRFFGGGLKIAPDQNRMDKDGKISSIIVHSLSRLLILAVFPSLLIGKHTKFTKYVTIKKGSAVSVEFDCPVALQLDGETIENVTSYSVTAVMSPLSGRQN